MALQIQDKFKYNIDAQKYIVIKPSLSYKVRNRTIRMIGIPYIKMHAAK